MKQLMLNSAVLFLGLAAGLLITVERMPPSNPMTTTAAGPSLESVRSLASLVTTVVSVSDVQVTELRGYTGSTRAAMLVRGDFTVGTDLTKARFDKVDPANKSLVVTLPTPKAGSPRVDLERTRLVALSTEGLWAVVPGHTADEATVDEAYRQAQAVVHRASLDSGWADQAKQQAEQVIRAFMKSLAWSAEVRWADG